MTPEIKYKIENGYAIITKVICPIEEEVLVIPKLIDNYEVKRIQFMSFEDYPNLVRKIIVSDGVEIIDSDSFNVCQNLEELILPKTIKSIGNNAFTECENLKKISIDKDNAFYSSYESNVIVDIKTKTLFYAAEDFKLPSDIKIIAKHSFSYRKCQKIIIPDSVEKIAQEAFYRCSNLNSIYISKNVKEASKAIHECFKINKIKINQNNPFIRYDQGLNDFVSKTNTQEIKIADLISFELNVSTLINDSFERITLTYNKNINTLNICYCFSKTNELNTSYTVDEKYKVIISDLFKLLGFYENRKNPSDGIFTPNFYNLMINFNSSNYSLHHKEFTDEKSFIEFISILNILSPIRLTHLKSIPKAKYDIDDINLTYITLPDLFYDMFETYNSMTGKAHPLETKKILLNKKQFSNRDNLKIIRIRDTANLDFENDLFSECDNLVSILIDDNDTEILKFINKGVLNKTIKTSSNYMNQFSVDDDSAF